MTTRQDKKTKEITDEGTGGGDSNIRLFTLKHPNDDREVAFGTGGDPNGSPVVLFPPLGIAGNRRMIASFSKNASAASLKLICVNRPGTGSTTPPSNGGPKVHVGTACQDIINVLDALGIGDKVGLLFLCAGTPFALAFASKYPDRVAEKLVGIAPFVSPADCDETKSLFQFGARHCPNWLVSPIVGGVAGSFMSSIRIMPQSMAVNGMTKQLSIDERSMFLRRSEEDEDWFQHTSWMFEEGQKGTSADLSVLLSPWRDVGINFGSIEGKVHLFHGEDDKLTPVKAAEWLSEQLPSAEVVRLSQGTHEGSLFMLHPEFEGVLKSLS